MAYRDTTMADGEFEYFIFKKNLQGDIVAVYDEYGFAAVTYTYDAWGNITETLYDTTSNGQYNSFRYRGYFYDEDTGLYYLNSRYYDPAIGRFLNPDIFINANGDLTGFNMYAYCSNNPVMGYDPTGEWTFSVGWSFSAFLIGGMTYSVSLSFDSSGNIALQTSEANVFKESSGGTFGLASVGISKSYSFTKLDTVDDLNGPALNIGVSHSHGLVSVGGEHIHSLHEPEKHVGGNLSLGLGGGKDVHVTVSETKTVGKFNVIDAVKKLWNDFTSLFD